MKVAILLDWYLYYAAELASALSRTDEVMLVTRDHAHEISSPGAPGPPWMTATVYGPGPHFRTGLIRVPVIVPGYKISPGCRGRAWGRT